jgi:hypothetical protein|tara:strand:+ start:882 stop:1154 length:273 start_codon:yes stop_codon:yes gene_type:complete
MTDNKIDYAENVLFHSLSTKENWEYVCESNPKFEVCPKCRGTLDYCYGLDDEEWKCEDCNTKWLVPLVRAWSLIKESEPQNSCKNKSLIV